jgi:hypothetical protein
MYFPFPFPLPRTRHSHFQKCDRAGEGLGSERNRIIGKHYAVLSFRIIGKHYAVFFL